MGDFGPGRDRWGGGAVERRFMRAIRWVAVGWFTYPWVAIDLSGAGWSDGRVVLGSLTAGVAVATAVELGLNARAKRKDVARHAR
ncbi:hypothetical protein [Streptomyces armeniacus]|nr:hypothetical protein [Streptomyces armeniacus]